MSVHYDYYYYAGIFDTSLHTRLQLAIYQYPAINHLCSSTAVMFSEFYALPAVVDNKIISGYVLI